MVDTIVIKLTVELKMASTRKRRQTASTQKTQDTPAVRPKLKRKARNEGYSNKRQCVDHVCEEKENIHENIPLNESAESKFTLAYKVMSIMTTSYFPPQTFCRENEFKAIEDFLVSRVEKKTQCGALYICGSPGTGKTLSVKLALSGMVKIYNKINNKIK